jgi:two-component system, cell cycle response regulator DivK
MNIAIHEQIKKQILIVDDSEDMRQLLQQILEEDDEYILLFAENASQAITLAQENHPDLILMDMSLPGMSGWDAVAYLRQQPAFKTLPIVAVTAHVSKNDQERARGVGCTAHLGKPFDVITVLDTIAELLH